MLLPEHGNIEPLEACVYGFCITLPDFVSFQWMHAMITSTV